MQIRRLLIVGVAALAATSAPALAASTAEQLQRVDVLIGPSATVTAGQRADLESAAERLNDVKPTKFVVRGLRPGNGPLMAEDLRNQLGAAIGYEGAVIVLWQRPTRGLGVAGPFPRSEGEAAFAGARETLQRDPIAGMIALADAIPGAADAGAGLGLDDGGAGLDDPGVPFFDEAPQTWNVVSGLFALIVLMSIGVAVVRVFRRRTVAASQAPFRGLLDASGPQPERLDPLFDGLAALLADLAIDIEVAPNRAAAVPEHTHAVLAYDEARQALTHVQSHADCDRIGVKLVGGIVAAKRARALLDGTPMPDDAPLLEGLCSFDPKHGAATTDAQIPGPRGGTASLPVCARCAAALASQSPPNVRTVVVAGTPVPYWQAVRSDWLSGLHSSSLISASSGLLMGQLDPTTSQPAPHDAPHWSSPPPAPIDDDRMGGASGGDFGDGAFAGGAFGAEAGGDSGSSAGGDVGGASGGEFSRRPPSTLAAAAARAVASH